MNDNTTKMQELQTTYNLMEDADKKKFMFETELNHWRQESTKMEREIQQEKYNIQIEQAKMKKTIEAEYKESLERFKTEAQ